MRKKTARQVKRDRIKAYIERNPQMALAKNIHVMNLKVAIKMYPALQEVPQETMYEAMKLIIDNDRDIRKAKEELRDEKKISRSAEEEELVTALEQTQQLELGYEPGVR